MGYYMNEANADAVLFTVMVFTTLVAVASAYFDSRGHEGGKEKPSFIQTVLRPTDHFLSARESAGALTIGLSFFASGMGAWVVYGSTELGATPSVSWWGVIGYSSASALPAYLLYLLGARVKDIVDTADLGGIKGFGITDFGLVRYGRVMQVYVAGLSCFYMFIYLVSELTSVANVYALVTSGGLADFAPTFAEVFDRNHTTESPQAYTTKVTLTVAVFTLLYTACAGLPASIFTDRFQGFIVAALMLILSLACFSLESNRVTDAEYKVAANWTADGFVVFITLWIAIGSAELFNQGSWQRVWAAKSEKDLAQGMAIGGVCIFIVMMFFGAMGMIAYANDPASYDSFNKLAYLSFFDLLAPMGSGIHTLLLVLITLFGASSVDTMQNALSSVLSHDLMAFKLSVNISRAVVVLINIPAIYLAAQQYSVLSLFLLADLICATAVVPVFLGLITEDVVFVWNTTENPMPPLHAIPAKKVAPPPLEEGDCIPVAVRDVPGASAPPPHHAFTLTAPTELGALLGCITGIIAVLVNGAVNGVDEAVDSITGEVLAKGPFSYFWLKNSPVCALCGKKTMVTFIIVPIVSGIFTLLFSKLDVMLRGSRARLPLIK